jgi:membrane-associated phospholipid phosphatase
VDGGALPFFWGSAAVAVGAFTLGSPPDQPRLFSEDEGGLESNGDTIPNYQVAILAGATPLLLALPSTEARWYHVKGAAEAIMTSAALTELAKNVFGRQRPVYVAGAPEDDRKSFFSGHSSLTLASTTYAGLYLHQHVFALWRAEGQSFAWWEVPPLAGLVALSFYIPYTRYEDNRHHLSDILTGAAVGTAMAVTFYAYQEARFRSSKLELGEVSLSLAPQPGGLAVVGSW